MTTYSTIASLPLPENTDGLVAERAFGDYANALDTLLIPQYSTTALRDAAMLSGKQAGMMCTVLGELQMWDGNQWWGTADTRYVSKNIATSRASTVTPAVDPHLTVALKGGSWYEINAYLSVASASTVPGFASTWTSTGSGITFATKSVIAPINGSTTRASTSVLVPASGNATVNNSGTPSVAGTGSLRIERLVVQCTSDDTLNFNWSQAVSNATPTTLEGGSHIEYRRIA